MFLPRNLLRVASAGVPRRFFAIDAAQHPVAASRELSARVLKLAEVRCSSSLKPHPSRPLLPQEFKALTVMEASDLARIVKKDLGLPDVSAVAAAPAAVAPPAAAPAAAAPAAAEKTEFEPKLESFGEQKIQVTCCAQPALHYPPLPSPPLQRGLWRGC